MNSVQKGPAAIRDFCEQQGYADFVVDGGLDYLIRSYEYTVQEVVDGYESMDLE